MTHSKSEIVKAVADKLGITTIDVALAIPNQRDGLPIVLTEEPDREIKEEFQIRASSGRVVMSFSSEELARKWADAQFKTHKHKAARVHLFKVTTITEQL